eukprot:Nk52_evm36s1485 gene=Nk52_evmTU36s1485
MGGTLSKDEWSSGLPVTFSSSSLSGVEPGVRERRVISTHTNTCQGLLVFMIFLVAVVLYLRQATQLNPLAKSDLYSDTEHFYPLPDFKSEHCDRTQRAVGCVCPPASTNNVRLVTMTVKGPQKDEFRRMGMEYVQPFVMLRFCACREPYMTFKDVDSGDIYCFWRHPPTGAGDGRQPQMDERAEMQSEHIHSAAAKEITSLPSVRQFTPLDYQYAVNDYAREVVESKRMLVDDRAVDTNQNSDTAVTNTNTRVPSQLKYASFMDQLREYLPPAAAPFLSSGRNWIDPVPVLDSDFATANEFLNSTMVSGGPNSLLMPGPTAMRFYYCPNGVDIASHFGSCRCRYAYQQILDNPPITLDEEFAGLYFTKSTSQPYNADSREPHSPTLTDNDAYMQTPCVNLVDHPLNQYGAGTAYVKCGSAPKVDPVTAAAGKASAQYEVYEGAVGPMCARPPLMMPFKKHAFQLNNPLQSVYRLYKDAVYARGMEMLDIHFQLALFSVFRLKVNPLNVASGSYKGSCFTPRLRVIRKIYSRAGYATGHEQGWGQFAIVDGDVVTLQDENFNEYDVIYEALHKSGRTPLGWTTGRGDGYRFILRKWNGQINQDPPQYDQVYVASEWVLRSCHSPAYAQSTPALRAIDLSADAPRALIEWVGSGHTATDVQDVDDAAMGPLEDRDYYDGSFAHASSSSATAYYLRAGGAANGYQTRRANFMLYFNLYQASSLGKMLVTALPALMDYHKWNTSDESAAFLSEAVVNQVCSYDETHTAQSIIQRELSNMAMYTYYADERFRPFWEYGLFRNMSEAQARRRYLGDDQGLRVMVIRDWKQFFHNMTFALIARTVADEINSISAKRNVMYRDDWNYVKLGCRLIFFVDSTLYQNALDENEQEYFEAQKNDQLEELIQNSCWSDDSDIDETGKESLTPKERIRQLLTRRRMAEDTSQSAATNPDYAYLNGIFLDAERAPPLTPPPQINSHLVNGTRGYRYMGSSIDIANLNNKLAKVRERLDSLINNQAAHVTGKLYFSQIANSITERAFPSVGAFAENEMNAHLLHLLISSREMQDLYHDYLVGANLKSPITNTRIVKELTDLSLAAVPYVHTAEQMFMERRQWQLDKSASNKLPIPPLNPETGLVSWDQYSVKELQSFMLRAESKRLEGAKRFQRTTLDSRQAKLLDVFVRHVFLNGTSAGSSARLHSDSIKKTLDWVTGGIAEAIANEMQQIFQGDVQNLRYGLEQGAPIEKYLLYVGSLFGFRENTMKRSVEFWVRDVQDKCTLYLNDGEDDPRPTESPDRYLHPQDPNGDGDPFSGTDPNSPPACSLGAAEFAVEVSSYAVDSLENQRATNPTAQNAQPDPFQRLNTNNDHSSVMSGIRITDWRLPIALSTIAAVALVSIRTLYSRLMFQAIPPDHAWVRNNARDIVHSVILFDRGSRQNGRQGRNADYLGLWHPEGDLKSMDSLLAHLARSQPDGGRILYGTTDLVRNGVGEFYTPQTTALFQVEIDRSGEVVAPVLGLRAVLNQVLESPQEIYEAVQATFTPEKYVYKDTVMLSEHLITPHMVRVLLEDRWRNNPVDFQGAAVRNVLLRRFLFYTEYGRELEKLPFLQLSLNDAVVDLEKRLLTLGSLRAYLTDVRRTPEENQLTSQQLMLSSYKARCRDGTDKTQYEMLLTFVQKCTSAAELAGRLRVVYGDSEVEWASLIEGNEYFQESMRSAELSLRVGRADVDKRLDDLQVVSSRCFDSIQTEGGIPIHKVATIMTDALSELRADMYVHLEGMGIVNGIPKATIDSMWYSFESAVHTQLKLALFSTNGADFQTRYKAATGQGTHHQRLNIEKELRRLARGDIFEAWMKKYGNALMPILRLGTLESVFTRPAGPGAPSPTGYTDKMAAGGNLGYLPLVRATVVLNWPEPVFQFAMSVPYQSGPGQRLNFVPCGRRVSVTLHQRLRTASIVNKKAGPRYPLNADLNYLLGGDLDLPALVQIPDVIGLEFYKQGSIRFGERAVMDAFMEAQAASSAIYQSVAINPMMQQAYEDITSRVQTYLFFNFGLHAALLSSSGAMLSEYCPEKFYTTSTSDPAHSGGAPINNAFLCFSIATYRGIGGFRSLLYRPYRTTVSRMRSATSLDYPQLLLGTPYSKDLDSPMATSFSTMQQLSRLAKGNQNMCPVHEVYQATAVFQDTHTMANTISARLMIDSFQMPVHRYWQSTHNPDGSWKPLPQPGPISGRENTNQLLLLLHLAEQTNNLSGNRFFRMSHFRTKLKTPRPNPPRVDPVQETVKYTHTTSVNRQVPEIQLVGPMPLAPPGSSSINTTPNTFTFAPPPQSFTGAQSSEQLSNNWEIPLPLKQLHKNAYNAMGPEGQHV